MIRKTSIGRVDRVSAPSQSKGGSGKSFEPGKSDGHEEPQPGTEGPGQPQSQQPLGKEEKKPSPGRRTLDPKDKLSDEFVKKIEQALDNGDWDHGGVPVGEPKAGAANGEPGDQSPVNVGDIQAPEGEDVRIWGDISKLEKDMDDAIKQGLENEEQAEAESKEAKTTAEKSRGRGKGGGARERLKIETLSKTDWATIFATKLTKYSKEATDYIPYNRRFVGGGRTMSTASLPDYVKRTDTLPPLNIIIDTSSSLSYRELEVILSEIQHAMTEAKMSEVNIMLWASSPYYHESYEDVTSDDFDLIVEDIYKNWKGGGNEDILYLEKIKELGWQQNFTINLTDGWIDNYKEPGSKTYDLALECFDIANDNLIWGIIFPNKQVTMNTWENTMLSKFPGEVIPIFLETKKFGQ